jgi:hypothetical protein
LAGKLSVAATMNLVTETFASSRAEKLCITKGIYAAILHEDVIAFARDRPDYIRWPYLSLLVYNIAVGLGGTGRPYRSRIVEGP